MSGELEEGVLEYDKVVEAYDELYGEEQVPKYLVALNRVGRYFRVALDLGCGTGLLSKYVKCELMVGIDPSLPMLKKAKARGVDVVQGVGEQLPFRSQAFDAVFLFTVVHEDLSMINESIRVSRNVVVVTLLKKLEYMSNTIKSCLSANFNRVSKVEIINRDYLKDFIFIAWLE